MRILNVEELLKIHYSVVTYIEENVDTSKKIAEIKKLEGMYGLFDLAHHITMDFYQHLKTIDVSGEGLEHEEFFDELYDFLDDRLK